MIDTSKVENLIEAYNECSNQLDDAYFTIEILEKRCAQLLEETKGRVAEIDYLYSTIRVARNSMKMGDSEVALKYLRDALWARNL